MSDLSRLLGDVYGASTPGAEDVETTEPTTPMGVPAAADDPPAPPMEAVEAEATRPAAPGWADDALLDEAFAEWVPGPPSDADAQERDILADVEPAEAVADSIDIDAWLGAEPVDAVNEIDTTEDDEAEAADLTELDATTAFDAFVPPAEPAPEIHPEREGPWSRESDDLLPRGRRSRRLSLRR